jgi:hypothetical protein
MEFLLPFILNTQRFQVKKPFYGENITIFFDLNLIKPGLKKRGFSPEIYLLKKRKEEKVNPYM